MKITKRFLVDNDACDDGVDAFTSVYGDNAELSDIIKLAGETGGDYLDFAMWLMPRCLTHVGKVRYAVFAAEKVLDIFERQHPDNKRPREAIEAAKRWIDNPCAETAKAARYAAAAVYYAAAAACACAADAAAYAAAYAADAYSAAYAVSAAYYAADATAAANAAVAADATWSAADAAYAAANAADAIKKECLAFGLSLANENTAG